MWSLGTAHVPSGHTELCDDFASMFGDEASPAGRGPDLPSLGEGGGQPREQHNTTAVEKNDAEGNIPIRR